VDAVDRRRAGDVVAAQGTLVTPVARRRPEQLARQVATLDSLSRGRVVFSAGLGGPIEDEFASFGDTTDPVVLAERLDEGLGLLSRYWSGETVEHDGPHYRVRQTALLPATVQRPRPAVWIAGYWPHRRPMRRAAQRDGAVPLFESARHGQAHHRRRCAILVTTSPSSPATGQMSRSRSLSAV
jgi:alkanesulfonate monooxygenase SsuD/methylene tetrahydromethanopterin reductase-like flavin-dependent oxidoreductase (luciferase family)